MQRAAAVRLAELRQPVAQRRVSLLRQQGRVQAPAQRAQLKLAIGMQRAVAIVMQLRRDHAVLRLRLQLQCAQGDIAPARLDGRIGPLRIRLQLQRPARLQQRALDTELQFAARLALRQLGRVSVEQREIHTSVHVEPLNLALRQFAHGSGKIQLRAGEIELQLGFSQQRRARQLPVQLAQHLPIAGRDLIGMTVPQQPTNLLQAHAVQLRRYP